MLKPTAAKNRSVPESNEGPAAEEGTGVARAERHEGCCPPATGDTADGAYCVVM